MDEHAVEPKPVGRYGHGMVLHETHGILELYIFGGTQESNQSESNELWCFRMPINGTSVPTWTLIDASRKNPVPSTSRTQLSMTHLPSNEYPDTLVMFGGISITTSALTGKTESLKMYNDLWTLDLVRHEWTQLQVLSKISPSPRFGMSAQIWANDNRASSSLVIFGGREWHFTPTGQVTDDRTLSDAWRFDFQTQVWTELKLLQTYPRVFYSMVVYDRAMYLFGGYEAPTRPGAVAYIYDELYRVNLTRSSSSNETSGFELIRNSARSGDVGPGARFLHSAVVMNHSMVVYGGRGQSHKASMWQLNFASSELEAVELGALVRFDFDVYPLLVLFLFFFFLFVLIIVIVLVSWRIRTLGQDPIRGMGRGRVFALALSIGMIESEEDLGIEEKTGLSEHEIQTFPTFEVRDNGKGSLECLNISIDLRGISILPPRTQVRPI